MLIDFVDEDVLLNTQIKDSSVRLINKDGKQLGIVCLEKALQLAVIENLDLVQVNSKSVPPVTKLMDYKKFVFNKSKALSGIRSKKFKVKEVKFHISTSENDFNIKIRNVCNFLKKNCTVRIIIVFRGREIVYKDVGFKLMSSILKNVELIGKVKSDPKLEGRQLISLVEPN